MKLKRLVAQGFKSFKDRTTINFDEGITGIVGPNGCGKSNVVDALFWIMGEQSAKHLRGQNMQDVIFAGSSKYPPAPWAEVSLILENTEKKHIHIAQKVYSPAEIQLTRKLYRNGETEYRINSIPARLKDIQEVFMDTGAGAKSYSIMAQGEVTRLVQAKPEDRRAMIEEVAGITKYKFKKKEALKKLDQAKLNFLRLSDLKIELESQLKRLKKQAEIALEAKKFRSQILELETLISLEKEKNLLLKIQELSANSNEIEQQQEQISTESLSLELELQDLELKNQETFKQQEAIQQKISEGSKQLALKQQQLQHENSLFQERQKMMSSIEQEKRKIKEEIQELQKTLETYQKDQEIEEKKQILQEKLEQLQEVFEEKQEQEETLKSQKQHHSHLLATHEKEISVLERSLFEIKTEKNSLGKKMEELLSFSEKNETQEQVISSKKEKLILEKEQLTLKEIQLKEEKETKKFALKILEEKIKTTNDSFVERDLELRKYFSEYASLSNIQKSFDLLREKKGHNAAEYKEKYEVFFELLDFKKEHSSLLSFAFEDCLQDFVTFKGEELLYNSTLVLKENNQKEQGQEEKKSLGKSLASFVEFKKYDSFLKVFCENRRVVRDLDKHLPEIFSFLSFSSSDFFVAIDEEARFKLIFLGNGNFKVVYPQEETAENTAFLEKKKTLMILEQEIPVLEQEKQKLQEDLELLKKEEESLSDFIQQKKQEISSTKIEIEKNLSLMAVLEQQQNSLSLEKKDILQKQDFYSKTKKVLLGQQEELEEKKSELEDSLQMQRDVVEGLEEQIEQAQEEIQNYQEALYQVKGEKQLLEQKISHWHQQREILIKQAEQKKDKIEELTQQEQNLLSNKQVFIEQQEKIQEEIEQYLSALHTLGPIQKELEGKLIEQEEQVRKIRILVKKYQDQKNELFKKKTENKGQLEKKKEDEYFLAKDFQEKFLFYLRDFFQEKFSFSSLEVIPLEKIEREKNEEGEISLPEICLEIQKVVDLYQQGQISYKKEMEEKIKKLKQSLMALGDINWHSAEEYEQIHSRYSFVVEQERQLNQSMSDLNQTIELIDHKSKERFTTAFWEVNERFKKIFPLLFAGGEAELKLMALGEGQAEDAQGIDIMACPPGKRMQNINLMSGGEKALTAVALIFSIFLVKRSPFCLLDEVDAPLDDANVGRFNELLRSMGKDTQFILITHNKKTMELNDTLYGITMEEPGVSKAVSISLQ